MIFLFFEGVLYFGWPSSGTMNRIAFKLFHIQIYNQQTSVEFCLRGCSCVEENLSLKQRKNERFRAYRKILKVVISGS